MLLARKKVGNLGAQKSWNSIPTEVVLRYQSWRCAIAGSPFPSAGSQEPAFFDIFCTLFVVRFARIDRCRCLNTLCFTGFGRSTLIRSRSIGKSLHHPLSGWPSLLGLWNDVSKILSFASLNKFAILHFTAIYLQQVYLFVLYILQSSRINRNKKPGQEVAIVGLSNLFDTELVDFSWMRMTLKKGSPYFHNLGSSHEVSSQSMELFHLDLRNLCQFVKANAACISALTAVMNIFGTASSTQIRVDIDKEMMLHGIYNMGSGMLSGLSANMVMSFSITCRTLGADGQQFQVLLLIFSSLIFVSGDYVVAVLPKFLPGSVLIWLSAELMAFWVWNSLCFLQTYEYCLVWAMILMKLGRWRLFVSSFYSLFLGDWQTDKAWQLLESSMVYSLFFHKFIIFTKKLCMDCMDFIWGMSSWALRPWCFLVSSRWRALCNAS